jgi:hypothetical protein
MMVEEAKLMEQRWKLGLFAALFMLGGSTLSYAQASRTWVSGVGDDANPCSRTAPCRTWAGAISKTAAGGEMNALDPGAFGAVTITKSISIEAVGLIAGTQSSGASNGVIVNAGATDVVVLRGLTLEGLGTGLAGVRFLAGGALHVEDCTINNFTTGIEFIPAANAQLFVNRTILRRNKGSGLTGGAVLIAPTGGTTKASLEHVVAEDNGFAFKVQDRSLVTIRNSTAAGNLFAAFRAGSTTMPVELFLDHVVAAHNGSTGVAAVGAAATIRLTNSTITDNAAGISNSGVIMTFNTNNISGNGSDFLGTAMVPVGQQ